MLNYHKQRGLLGVSVCQLAEYEVIKDTKSVLKTYEVNLNDLASQSSLLLVKSQVLKAQQSASTVS